MKKILLNNLSGKIERYRKIYDESFSRVIASGHFILGHEVDLFEEEFARYIGVENCISVANGTDAIRLALATLDLDKGSIVALSANAGMYSSIAINDLGLNHCFIDVDYSTNNLPINEVIRAINLGVKAIIVTHLYGLINSEISEISEMCKKNNVWLIEDCAQAHGATMEGKKAGSFSDLSCFSFYPTKNLGALGDAGAVCTKNRFFAARLKQLRQYGWAEKYAVEIPRGMNSRMDEIQAAILRGLLPYLDEDNQKRREIASIYNRGITSSNIELPKHCGENYVSHLFVIKSERRDALKAFLRENNIYAEVHYPIPDHQQQIFIGRYHELSLPITERLCQLNLTLPCYPEMESVDQDAIIELVNSKKWR